MAARHTTAVVATALTIAAMVAPGVASAAGCQQGEQCRIAVNHNEVLATTACT